GLPNTKINAKVFRASTTTINKERSDRFGLGSTTAREMIELLERLHQGKLVSPEACQAMLEHMKKCDDKDKFPRFLPPKVVVAHKTGSVNAARTDAGILYLPQDAKTGSGALKPKAPDPVFAPVAVCVLTDENEDKSWRPDNAGNLLCARVAQEIYEYYQGKNARTS